MRFLQGSELALFRQNLESLKKFCAKIHFCFPNLKSLDFVENESSQDSIKIQHEFLHWSRIYNFPKLPHLQLENDVAL